MNSFGPISVGLPAVQTEYIMPNQRDSTCCQLFDQSESPDLKPKSETALKRRFHWAVSHPGWAFSCFLGEKQQKRAVYLVAGSRAKMPAVPCCAHKHLFVRLEKHCTIQCNCVVFFFYVLPSFFACKIAFCKCFLHALFLPLVCSVALVGVAIFPAHFAPLFV